MKKAPQKDVPFPNTSSNGTVPFCPEAAALHNSQEFHQQRCKAATSEDPRIGQQETLNLTYVNAYATARNAAESRDAVADGGCCAHLDHRWNSVPFASDNEKAPVEISTPNQQPTHIPWGRWHCATHPTLISPQPEP
jgi:hypothetical protein|mmetsp:Transcript_17331/g.28262  ORF Transcript_17331/g.28262 Transcript_17331/m.28262 type:complete len:137 (+) Transcript_17331:470-880(+)